MRESSCSVGGGVDSSNHQFPRQTDRGQEHRRPPSECKCVCESVGLAQLALHNPHIWANSLKPVCFLCFLLFWCPLLPVIETGTLKIYTKMVLYMKNEFLTSNTPSWGLNPHSTNLRVAFYL